MAKVETFSRNNSSCFIGNDSSLADLVSLDISAESSRPKFDFDFDISILQSDSEISEEKQCFDKEASEILHLLSEGVNVQSNSRKTVNSDMSLGTVAKHQPENHRMLSDLCFEGDINLTDVLYTYDQPSFLKRENGSDGDLNFFGLYLRTEHNAETNKSENNVRNENVSDLVDSCHVLGFHPAHSVSLDSLAASHILKNESNGSKNKFDENFSDSFVFNFKNDDSNVFQSFNLDISSEKTQENQDLSSLLNELNFNHGCETNENNHRSNDEASDTELTTDIDLSFCIKNKSADKLSPDMPESVDSGFDETDLILIKSTSGKFEKSLLNTDSCLFGKEKLNYFKQSLLSRAISAIPKIDESRHAKLKKIRAGLFQNLPSSVVGCNEKEHSQISKKIIDHSNECVLTSQLLTISDTVSELKNAM